MIKSEKVNCLTAQELCNVVMQAHYGDGVLHIEVFNTQRTEYGYRERNIHIYGNNDGFKLFAENIYSEPLVYPLVVQVDRRVKDEQ